MDENDGIEYPLEYILENPIPARCTKCKEIFTDGQKVRIVTPKGRVKIVICNEAIRAPALSGCACWKCHGKLAPFEKGGPVTVEQVEQLKSLSKQQPCLQLF